MQLTQFTDYALRTLIYVALKKNECCTIPEISKSYKISKNHLIKVVHKLSQLRILKTTRGHKGGITLNGQAKEFNLGELVQKIEPSFFIVECFDTNNKNCIISPYCCLKGILYEARKSFFETLRQYTLHDIIQNEEELSRVLMLNE